MTKEEAIKELRGMIGQLTEGCQEAIKVLIPELTESEDERIRKFICSIIDNLEPKDFVGVKKMNVIAWLEKQKYDRMKPIYDARESFESALEKAWNDYHNGYENVDKLEDDYVECAHAKGFREGYLFGIEKQKENPKSFDSIPSDCTSDAKCENKHNEEGDFVFELRQIISSHRYSDIYGEYTNDEEGMASEILELCKCELEKQKEQKPAEWNKEDEKKRNLLIDILEVNHPNGYFKVNPANTLNMEAIHVEELIDWLKSLKERMKGGIK